MLKLAVLFLLIFFSFSFGSWSAPEWSQELQTEGDQVQVSDEERDYLEVSLEKVLNGQNRLRDMREAMERLRRFTGSDQGLRKLLSAFKERSIEVLEKLENLEDVKKGAYSEQKLLESRFERLLWAVGSTLTSQAARPSGDVAGDYARFLISQMLFPPFVPRTAKSNLGIRLRAMWALGELLVVVDNEGREDIRRQLKEIAPTVKKRRAERDFDLSHALDAREQVAVGGERHADFLDQLQLRLFSLLQLLCQNKERFEQDFVLVNLEVEGPVTFEQIEKNKELRSYAMLFEFLTFLSHNRGLRAPYLLHADFLESHQALKFDREGAPWRAVAEMMDLHFSQIAQRFEQGVFWDANWVVSREETFNAEDMRSGRMYGINRALNPQKVGGFSLAHAHPDVWDAVINLYPSLGQVAVEHRYRVETQVGPSLRQRMTGYVRERAHRFLDRVLSRPRR